MIAYVYAVLFAAIAYMSKDSAVDLIAYFIILIQRPIKIGDYVKLMSILLVLCVRLRQRRLF